MLVIRQAQVDVLRAAAARQFARRLVEHSMAHFPTECRYAGPAGVLATVALGMQLARAAGLSSRRETALYLSLMWMLGSHFETDPRHAHLYDGVPERGVERLKAVAVRAMDALDGLRGADNARLVRTLVRVTRVDAASLPAADALAGWLAALTPAEDERRSVAVALAETAGRAVCARHRIDGDGALAVVSMHALLLGSDFDRDPQFPWAAEILSADGADVAERLLGAAQDYARALLAGAGA